MIDSSLVMHAASGYSDAPFVGQRPPEQHPMGRDRSLAIVVRIELLQSNDPAQFSLDERSDVAVRDGPVSSRIALGPQRLTDW
jgi:hypothetical protein